jgi:hypothetical protein
MVTLDLATWTALGTWLLVVGTLGLMYWQTRQTQRLNSANAVMALRERFDSTRMVLARRNLSRHLLANSEGDLENVEVAAFFELVGTLTHHKVLDEDLVWEAFGTWIAAYWWALRHPVDRIAHSREHLQDPLVLREFEWLFARISIIDRRRLGRMHAKVSESTEGETTILRTEAALQIDPLERD